MLNQSARLTKKNALVRAVRLTLVCHALTQAQKQGYLAQPNDCIVPVSGDPLALPQGTQLLAAPERRTVQTATWLGESVHIEPALADGALGHWQGLPLKQVQAEQPEALAQWLADPLCAPPHGEPFVQVCERVGAWLSAFDRPGDWWAVTHPWVIRAALVSVLECPMVSAQHIDVMPLSQLALSRAGRWRLRLG